MQLCGTSLAAGDGGDLWGVGSPPFLLFRLNRIDLLPPTYPLS